MPIIGGNQGQQEAGILWRRLMVQWELGPNGFEGSRALVVCLLCPPSTAPPKVSGGPPISKFVSSPEPSHYSGFLHCQKTWNKLHFEPLPLVWETPTALGSSSHSATVELGGLRPPPEPWAFPQLGPRAASSFLLQAFGDLSFPLTGAFWVAAGALDPPTRGGGALII